ncbi:TetR/AcrR family transcriptional regulator [Acidicapsa ligni]|uniref:TetR/AcrR family transcriptional regulator n=1 Tax=Acidicapsa ligni TaxID=542300 RepID=UPI0021E00CB8|nr:TetR/AcrR family transcriptional regulator [Acidicapsa ligni]
MFVSKEQTALNRDSLLQAASRLFREKGIDGVGVADIAKEAGLTHGALYKHFPSKEALAAEAFKYAAANKLDSRGNRKQTFEKRLNAMFSTERIDTLAEGCPMTASASEIARQGTAVAESFTRVFKETIAEIEMLIEGPMPAAQKRHLAISALAAQIGAVAVARAIARIEPSLSEEVLKSVHKTVKPTHAIKRAKNAKVRSFQHGSRS